MDSNNNNTLTFENHDTYIYYVDEIKKSFQIVELTPTNPEDTDNVTYLSVEGTLYTNSVKSGVIKFNDFIRSKLNNITTDSNMVTIITDDGILMGNWASELNPEFISNRGSQIKTLATYKSGKYANYINVEIQIDYEDSYRIVTISY
jgi:hypothetical protein